MVPALGHLRPAWISRSSRASAVRSADGQELPGPFDQLGDVAVGEPVGGVSVEVAVGVSLGSGVAVDVGDGVSVQVGGSTTGPGVREGGAGELTWNAVGRAGPPLKSGLVRTQYAPPETAAQATISRISSSTTCPQLIPMIRRPPPDALNSASCPTRCIFQGQAYCKPPCLPTADRYQAPPDRVTSTSQQARRGRKSLTRRQKHCKVSMRSVLQTSLWRFDHGQADAFPERIDRSAVPLLL